MEDYNHLNGTDKIDFSIPETAKLVFFQNYGARRFFEEILKLRQQDDNQRFDSYARNTDKLRDLLEAGFI
jgi:hypothetical protein